jgi:para-aminobenzoate synthetase component 1
MVELEPSHDSDRAPLVAELWPPPDPPQAFEMLARRRHCLFLDSALKLPELGRYSFLTAEPFDYQCLSVTESDPLGRLAGALGQFRAAPVAGLPPFQGGAAGLFAYELGRTLERIPSPAADEFGIPVLAVGLYDAVIAWDHLADRAWILSHGFPEVDPVRRRQRAADRLVQFQSWLRRVPLRSARREDPPQPVLTRDALAKQYTVGDSGELLSGFSRSGYLAAVKRAIDYIHAGDLFQVNLSQRLLFPAKDDAIELFLRLRQRNPAPFAGYFDGGTFQVASASPERFLQVRDGRVEARPTKGTRPRTTRPEADLFAARDLETSEKDQAENVMIVDLLRNDLSRVCKPDSVRVPQLCGLECYAYVQHLVSVVRGELEDHHGSVDLLRAAFPGGSVTGAPKIRAMEVISELEPVARGAYCGSLGYIGWDGSLDTSILIRTVTASHGWWQLPVGGGIVAQSDPQAEYEETWQKAEGLLRSLRR